MRLRRGKKRRIGAAGERRRGGDAAGAIEMLAPIILADPENTSANVEMARALRVLDDLDGA